MGKVLKEFDKWLDELDSIQVADKFNNQNRAIARCAWEAALKWTGIKLENYTIDDVLYLIEEELKE